MARDRNLINAFDDCVERLSTGESLDTILKDYPESADYLRDLLMISEMVSQVHNEDDEVTTARTRGRQKLQRVLQDKPKRIPRSRLRSYGPWAAVATLVILIAGGFLIASLTSNGYGASFSLTGTSIAQSNTTIESQLTATQINSEVTAMANGDIATPEPFEENFDITATALLLPTMTIPASPTPVPTLNVFSTGTPVPATGIIPTSVASMQEVTGGVGQVDPANEDAVPDTGGSGGGVPDGIKTTRMPVLSVTPAPTGTATPTPEPTQTLAPQGTTVADGSLINPAQPDVDSPTALPALIPLNAGEIDDNADWDTYLLYRRNFLAQGIPVYDIDVSGRQIITVVDETGRPILGATVRILADTTLIAESVTYATGKTLFFPNINLQSRDVNQFTVMVEKNGSSAQFTLDRREGNQWEVTLPTVINRDVVPLDVLFLIDTTSSMGDEIQQLQNNILHISDQVDKFADNVDVRYGLVLYREHNNFEYLTRRHDFTLDVREFQTYLNAVTANSGDNNPDWDEALNVALDEALNQMSWHGGDTIKLMFLVSDARPHINHSLEPVTYDQSILRALSRGIKIHPIASSGLEPAGEFIFRQIAQVTMGHFVFLTYDDGVPGTPGDVRPELNVGDPDTAEALGDYTVNRLADLVLRLIRNEIWTFQGRDIP